METNENEKKKKKKCKKALEKDSLAYLRHREKANARKSKYLDNMTDEQKEIKRAKDRERYRNIRKRRAENKAKISDLTEREKQELRNQWKQASKRYRDKKKMLANAVSDTPPPSDNELDIPVPPSRDSMQRQCGTKRTPGTVQVKSLPVPNDAEKQTPRTGRPRHDAPCSTQPARVAVAPLLRSPVRPRGSALPCGPMKVTSGPSPVLRTNITVGSDFNPVITKIKSEADPIKQEEDPQSDDTVSLAEDTDQLSDADQPSEDLMPLSTAQVPPSNAPDPLSDVKVEELEVEVDEVEVDEVEVDEVEVDEVEVTGLEDVNRPVELPTVPLPLNLRQELFLAGNDCYNLIRKQANQINKLCIRLGKHRQKIRSYVQTVSRRNKKISDLQAEVAALRNFIGEHGLEASTIGRGKLDAPRIQIQSSNTAAVRKKSNRQLLIVQRDCNRPKSLVSAQPTSDILRKSLLGALNTSDNRQKSSVGVKRTLKIQEKSSVGIPDTSDVLQKSSVGVQHISDINIHKSSAGVKRISDILNNPSVAVQPVSAIPQTSPVGFQRTSDIGQNALVIQIDGMHNTVLQPKLVRLDDNSVEMG